MRLALLALALLPFATGCATYLTVHPIGRGWPRAPSGRTESVEVVGASVTLDRSGLRVPHLLARTTSGREVLYGRTGDELVPRPDGTPLPPCAFATVAVLGSVALSVRSPVRAIGDDGAIAPWSHALTRDEAAHACVLVLDSGWALSSPSWLVTLYLPPDGGRDPASSPLLLRQNDWESPTLALSGPWVPPEGSGPTVLDEAPYAIRDSLLVALTPVAIAFDLATSPLQAAVFLIGWNVLRKPGALP